MDLTRRGPGYLAVLVSAATWATSGIFIRFILDNTAISPLALAFWRDFGTFVALILIVVVFRPSLLRIEARHLKHFAGLGCLSLGIFHVLWNMGVIMNGVAVSTVQQAIMPIIVAVAAIFIWGEVFTLYKGLAVGFTLLGAVLISGLVGTGLASIDTAGLLVGFAIPITYAMYSLFGKHLTARYHPLTILTYGFLFAVLTLLPFQFFVKQPHPAGNSALLWMSGLVFVSTIFPFAVYTLALRWLQVGVAGILCMLEIPFAALYSFLLLGERLTPIQYLGALGVIVGIVTLNLGKRGRPITEKEPAKSQGAEE
jgi:drug/metabolite transporter (DMT)-like permease